ncbi:hypothetical protein ACP275_02G103600 [Erythranthe tilingii]
MSREYDNWERLVAAVIKREDLKYLALCESFSSSTSADFSSCFSFEDETTFGASRISNETIVAASRGVQRIKFKEVKKATKNFRSDLVLGEGSFGRVFKGWINENTFTCSSKPGSGTRTAVAIKKWNSGSFQGHEEWLKEVNYLGYLRHPNLVKLLGYCSEEDNMVLVYEFVPNGSLDNHLFRGGHQSLPWMTRRFVNRLWLW